MRTGNLYVVSAPSGAGKTTICRTICDRDPRVRLSVSYTTRPPRPGEEEGRDYSFIDEEEFRDMVEGGEFVEWAKVHGNFYGTSRLRLEEMLGMGLDVLLDIDVQGARQIRRGFSACTLVFVLPPSFDVLMVRLRGRMSDSDASIRERLRTAREEMVEYRKYDYVIVNDILEETVATFAAIIRAERAKTTRADQAWIDRVFFGEE